MTLPASTVPDGIVLISPFIVAILSGWLGQAHFPAWANAAIAFGVILIVSVVCVFVAGATFTSNLGVDFILIFGYMNAVMYGVLSPLHKYLILGPSSQYPSVRQLPEPEPEPDIPDRPAAPPTPIILPQQERPVFQPRATLQGQEEEEKHKETPS